MDRQLECDFLMMVQEFTMLLANNFSNTPRENVVCMARVFERNTFKDLKYLYFIVYL